MKTMKEIIEKSKIIILNENINLSRKGVIYNNKGIKVINTQHGIDQTKSRLGRFDQSQLSNLFDKYTEYFSKNTFDKNTFVLLYSKSFKQGVVFKVRNQNTVVIITLLPMNHNKAKNGTEKIFIEGINCLYFEID